jgi:predicted aminopeptidase
LRKFTGKRSGWRAVAVIALLLGVLQIEGCYYMQAIRGQMELMGKRQPIPEVINDEASPDDLKDRLAIVLEARDYAVETLLLPDNKSYRTYADLGRDYVVWNVFAAPEFSLTPKTWCYPVAGCVAYRGYFAEAAARDKAADLEEDGYDVSVGGVSAYSTLGKFADPVLSTMMRWSDVQLVNTIFHELAHQKLYIKGDTAFNESFATAVADIGVDWWLDDKGTLGGAAGFRENRGLRRSMMALVESAKVELTEVYESQKSNDAKRLRKRQILDRLSADAGAMVSGTGTRNWLAAPLNNAQLASLALYEGYQGAFAEILLGCEQQLDCFYAEAEKLAALDKDERHRRLDEMAD